MYWIENTVPEEFRDAIREGVLAWHEAFEAVGFKNAIIVKQMPVKIPKPYSFNQSELFGISAKFNFMEIYEKTNTPICLPKNNF